jgi:hypothetical protein
MTKDLEDLFGGALPPAPSSALRERVLSIARSVSPETKRDVGIVDRMWESRGVRWGWAGARVRSPSGACRGVGDERRRAIGSVDRRRARNDIWERRGGVRGPRDPMAEASAGEASFLDDRRDGRPERREPWGGGAMKRRPIRTFLRALGLTLGVLFALALAGSLALRVYGQRRLGKARSALAQQGVLLDPTSYESPKIPEAENAAVWFQAGAAAVVLSKEDRTFILASSRLPSQEWDEERTRRARALLAVNHGALETLHRGAALSRSQASLCATQSTRPAWLGSRSRASPPSSSGGPT